MNDNVSFQKIEEDKERVKENKEEVIDKIDRDAFVVGLPDWDLEPLYETVRRNDKK